MSNVTPAPSTGQVKSAAAERATRTILQGLGLDLLVAIALALGAWLPDSDVTDGGQWAILGVSLVKTVLQAIVAYVLRIKRPPATETAVA